MPFLLPMKLGVTGGGSKEDPMRCEQFVYEVVGEPGQAPGGGPISSCVIQTGYSDYSHTVLSPQSRAFLQAFTATLS